MSLPRHRVYGLIGFPLTHSFSMNYFNNMFESENIDAEYVNFEIPEIGDLMEVISENPNLSGLNVTIPYKEQVIPYMSEMDTEAAHIGAVNVIKIIRDKNGDIRLKGYNSDAMGFQNSIAPLINPKRNRALILGTGGASKAINRALINLGVEPVFVSRTPAEGQLSYAQLTPEVMESHRIIVNCTPLGMYPNVDRCPDIPYDLLTPDHPSPGIRVMEHLEHVNSTPSHSPRFCLSRSFHFCHLPLRL